MSAVVQAGVSGINADLPVGKGKIYVDDVDGASRNKVQLLE